MGRKRNIDNEANERLNAPKTRKLISLSPSNFEMLNGIIQDEAALINVSDSNIVEQALLDRYLVDNDRVRYYTKKIYTDGLKNTFLSLFQELAAGIGFNASHDNALPLVDFARECSSFAYHGLTGNEPMFRHFQSQCESVFLLLKDKLEAKNMTIEEQRELKEIELLISLLPTDFVPYNYYNLVVTNWDTLGNSSFTFRMLCGLTELTTGAWRETPENRAEARKIISEVVSAWG